MPCPLRLRVCPPVRHPHRLLFPACVLRTARRAAPAKLAVGGSLAEKPSNGCGSPPCPAAASSATAGAGGKRQTAAATATSPSRVRRRSAKAVEAAARSAKERHCVAGRVLKDDPRSILRLFMLGVLARSHKRSNNKRTGGPMMILIEGHVRRALYRTPTHGARPCMMI